MRWRASMWRTVSGKTVFVRVTLYEHAGWSYLVDIDGRVVCESVFFFSSRRRHTRYWRDWSSDVCSSDLLRYLDPSRPSHLLNARHRLQGPQEHASRDSVRKTGNIQAIVIAIDEVHISVTGRTEKNGIPCRTARSRVRRCVAFAEIRLGFHNPSRQNSPSCFPDQQFPQQSPRHPSRIAIEELRVQPDNAAAHIHSTFTKSCHPERSEGSAVRRKMQIPRFARDDNC